MGHSFRVWMFHLDRVRFEFINFILVWANFKSIEFGSGSLTIRVEFELGQLCVNNVCVGSVSIRVKFGWGQLRAKLIWVGLGGG